MAASTERYRSPKRLKANIRFSISYVEDLIGTVFIRGGQVIADVVVIGVTWKATYHVRKEKSWNSLTRVLFTNGEYPFSQA